MTTVAVRCQGIRPCLRIFTFLEADTSGATLGVLTKNHEIIFVTTCSRWEYELQSPFSPLRFFSVRGMVHSHDQR